MERWLAETTEKGSLVVVVLPASSEGADSTAAVPRPALLLPQQLPIPVPSRPASSPTPAYAGREAAI